MNVAHWTIMSRETAFRWKIHGQYAIPQVCGNFTLFFPQKFGPINVGEQTPETEIMPRPQYKATEHNKYTIISAWLHFVSQMA
jgi:hypothetical protein